MTGDVHCLCGAVDSRDTTVTVASYRPTTEDHDRCTARAATQGLSDMNAVS